MAEIIKFLDPVQGLIDYIEDIKPYHTKVIETLIEHVAHDAIDVTLLEDYSLDIKLDYSHYISLKQTYVVKNGENVITTTIPTRTNIKFEGNTHPIKEITSSTVLIIDGDVSGSFYPTTTFDVLDSDNDNNGSYTIKYSSASGSPPETTITVLTTGTPALPSLIPGGSPLSLGNIFSTERVYDFYGTFVYINGVLQIEKYGTLLVGDYSITGPNEITFTNFLSTDDVIEIYTLTQTLILPNICTEGGYGSLMFDDPDTIPVLSPDSTKSISDFPAITTNSFIVLGDRRQEFDPNSGLTFRIVSFIEDRIVDVTASLPGSPITGGSFTILGDSPAFYSVGDIFTVTGSLRYLTGSPLTLITNDTAYKITGVTFTSPSSSPLVLASTTLEVDGQIVQSDDVSGFVKTIDSNNNGSFSVISSIFTEEAKEIRPYTKVFIAGITLIPPAVLNLDSNQRYVSLVSIGAIEYNKILSYSNALKYYNANPPANLLQTPNEGVVYAAIVGLSQSSPSYFVVDGNYENSNVFVDDGFSVIESTDNNDTYTIQSISYNSGNNTTTFGVSDIHDSAVDGFVKLDIPSNVFIIDGDYTDFFTQGVNVKAITGNKSGQYTTLYSKFINGETQIRVLEDLIHGRGRLIAGTVINGSPPSQGFLVDNDLTVIFKQDTQFNVVSSLRNDGSYTTTADSTYDEETNATTIFIAEPFDSSDSTGEIHKFVKGSLTYSSVGFGQTPELCELVPETIIKVEIKDRLYIDGLGIRTYDDILVHGINAEGLGYDLPPSIFAAGIPSIDPIISPTAPSSPSPDDLWFDTSLNTAVLSAPGILKQYLQILDGSPPTYGWIGVPKNKIYWIDTVTNYVYYRMIYQYYDKTISGYPTPTLDNKLDTGWILEYLFTPPFGFDESAPPVIGTGSRKETGYEAFFAHESSTAVAETVFTLSTLTIPLTTGSPIIPDFLMLEVYVNNTIANVNVLSTTSFDILSPRLKVGDLVEAKVFDDSGIPSNNWVSGGFDADAAITETFDMLLGYKFYINGTESTGSPVINNIYIPDTQNGAVYNIFTQGSPPDNTIEIVDSSNNDGIYTVLSVSQPAGSPIDHVVLTVAETLSNTGIFGGSPLIESGHARYQQWFQYFIVNTTNIPINTIVVMGDATDSLSNPSVLQIKIIYSVGSPNNDGIYTISSVTYDGRNTTITTLEPITNSGNSGGWVESI